LNNKKPLIKKTLIKKKSLINKKPLINKTFVQKRPKYSPMLGPIKAAQKRLKSSNNKAQTRFKKGSKRAQN
jgi:hypothetical protein